MPWTEQQTLTLEACGKNILVSAAAGSGKTAVLTERILRLVVEKHVPVRELLVVTFTEAAASEMKSRIAAALTIASEEDSFAETQLRQLGSAKIMTMHAFCLTILKNYYYLLDLDPSFSVADAKRAEALREEAADKVFAETFADPDEEFKDGFIKFLFAYSDMRSEKKVRYQILKTYEFIMTLPDPFKWLNNSVKAQKTHSDFSSSPVILFAGRETAYRLKTARVLLEQTGEDLMSLGLSQLAEKNSRDLETVSLIERSFLEGDLELTGRLIRDHTFEYFRAGKEEKEIYEGIRALVKHRRDRAKEILLREIGPLLLSQTEEAFFENAAFLAPYAEMLEALVTRFSKTYDSLKRDEKLVDFADFEHMALKILENDNVADYYRKRLSNIFIDEYQDSNYVQEALISRISRTDNVFMVGDVKQSIYSFRNAAPEIFLEKHRNFGVPGREDQKDIRIDLSSNFRSKASVINAVNFIFKTLMESHYSGMEYDADAELITGIKYDPEAEGKVSLTLIKKDKEKEYFDSEAECEAALCAKLIGESVGRPYYDAKKGETRALRFSDFAILVRTMKDSADLYKKTLESYGIPAVADRGEGYFETVEVDTFLALLRAIVNLRRDVPLAAAMCSVVFSFELSELADIRSGKMDGLFYTAFLEYSESGADQDLRQKCKAAAERLARWRDEERFMRLDDFLWKLMRESGYYDHAGTLSRGARRQANLRNLLDRAADFQKGRIEGLRGFLSYLEKIKLRGGIAQAALLTGTEDICRIMTVHGSKGLEFPVVFICGMGKPLVRGGFDENTLLLDRDLGLSLQWRDPGAHTYKKTLLHSIIKLKQGISERAEAIRLLYVGMTRAMDSLHMIGTTGDPEKQTELYGTDEIRPFIDTDIPGASSWLQLILPSAMKRKDLFEVSVTDPETIAEAPSGTKGTVPFILRQEPSVTAGAAERSGESMVHSAAFTYPYAASVKLKSKYSVTELNRGGNEEIISGLRAGPLFFMAGENDETPDETTAEAFDEASEDAGLSKASKGTAIHKALELLDIKEAYARRNEPEWFNDYLSGLLKTGVLGKAEADSVDPEILRKFANSNLAARAAASGFLMKEVPFNMKIPYKDEQIIVQGIIDLLFEEDGGLVVVDFKSGWFDISSFETESERYRLAYGGQLGSYRTAAELIFEKPVRESLIYLTRTGASVDI